MSDDFQEMSEELERIAQVLEGAASHCRTAAGHFTERESARGAAHTLAAIGHVSQARKSLDKRAEFHASRSLPHD